MSDTYDFNANSASLTQTESTTLYSDRLISAYEEPSTGIKEIFYNRTYSTSFRFVLVKYTKTTLTNSFTGLSYDGYTTTKYESPTLSSVLAGSYAPTRIDSDTYRVWLVSPSAGVGYREWHLSANTVDSSTTFLSGWGSTYDAASIKILDGNIHIFAKESSGGVLKIKWYSADLEGGSLTDNGYILSKTGGAVLEEDYDAFSHSGFSSLEDYKIVFNLYYYLVSGGSTYIYYFKWKDGQTISDSLITSSTYYLSPINGGNVGTSVIQLNDDSWYRKEYCSIDPVDGSTMLYISLVTTESGVTLDTYLDTSAPFNPPTDYTSSPISPYTLLSQGGGTYSTQYTPVKRTSDSQWGFIDKNFNFTEFNLNDSTFSTVYGLYPTFGKYSGDVLVLSYGTTYGGYWDNGLGYTGYHILTCNLNGTVNNYIEANDSSTKTQIYNSLNFFLNVHSSGFRVITWVNATNPSGGQQFLVLKGEDNVFTQLETSTRPDRLDHSLTDFLLTEERTINQLNKYAFWFSEQYKYSYLPLTVETDVYDFRYVSINAIDDNATHLVTMFTVGSGIHYLDLATEGPTYPYFVFPGYAASGLLLDMIETSNYMPPYQYVFVSYSGGFLQQDPYSTGFVESSTNLPESRITCIRMDDRF